MLSEPVDAVVFETENQVAPGKARLKPLGEEEVLCETVCSTISPGTELRMLAGHYGARGRFPYVPGYSSIGRILEVGSKVKGWRAGDLVNARNTQPFLDKGALYGAHSRYQVLSTTTTDRPVALPEGADPLDYAFVDLAAISLRGVEAAAPKPGETAVVIGQGMIGAFSAAWLAEAGCRVIAIDFEEARRRRALAIGAAFALSPEEAPERLPVLCNGGADIVVESSGTTAGVELAFKTLRKKPQNYSREYVVEPIRFYGGDWPRLVFQANYLEPLPWKPDGVLPGEGAILVTPRDRGTEERQRVVEAIRSGRLKTALFRDRVVPWKEAPSVYEDLRNRRAFSGILLWKEA